MLPKNNSTRNVFEGKQTRSRLQQQVINLSSQKKGNLSQVERKKVKIIPLRKLFILDTNVILSDPNCIFKFEDNDVYIPTVVRAELDNHKKGTDDTARNSREFSRTLKSELSKHSQNIRDGIPLKEASKKIATGRLYLQTNDIEID